MKTKIFPLFLALCLTLSFSACSEKPQEVSSKPSGEARHSQVEPTPKADKSSPTSAIESVASKPASEAAPTSTPEPPAESTPAPDAQEPQETSGMRPEFKEAMDSYESFMNEYVEFMKKYQESPNDLSLLADYATFLTQYAEMTDKFDEWDEGEMSDEELAYYIDVTARVQKKLLEVA